MTEWERALNILLACVVIFGVIFGVLWLATSPRQPEIVRLAPGPSAQP